MSLILVTSYLAGLRCILLLVLYRFLNIHKNLSLAMSAQTRTPAAVTYKCVLRVKVNLVLEIKLHVSTGT